MVEQFNFARLPVIRFGTGASACIPEVVKSFGNNLLLITGKGSFSSGKWGKKILAGLDRPGIKYSVVSVSGEPGTAVVDEISAGARENIPDAIMAVGGGSVLDTGKAVAAMVPVSGSVWDYLEGNPDIVPHPGTRLPLIAVPTTAGTGSEATKNAVLTKFGDPVLKRSLRHDNFVPDIAIVDPELTIDCPPDITAASGLDAITQLLEALVSVKSSEMTDILAYRGLELGLRSIRRVVENGNDLDARADMSFAALLSGIVLANAGLGAVHGFASVIGASYDIPHGVICGTMLGAVTRANINKLQESGSGNKYLEKFSAAGKIISKNPDAGDDYYLSCLADYLDRLVDDLGLPKLARYGVDGSGCASVAGETDIKNNPANLNRYDLERILLSRL